MGDASLWLPLLFLIQSSHSTPWLWPWLWPLSPLEFGTVRRASKTTIHMLFCTRPGWCSTRWRPGREVTKGQWYLVLWPFKTAALHILSHGGVFPPETSYTLLFTCLQPYRKIWKSSNWLTRKPESSMLFERFQSCAEMQVRTCCFSVLYGSFPPTMMLLVLL